MKRNFLAIAAVVIAISASAFTMKSHNVALDNFYYGYDQVAGDYKFLGTDASSLEQNCVSGNNRCIVISPSNQGTSITVTTANSLQQLGTHPNSQYDF